MFEITRFNISSRNHTFQLISNYKEKKTSFCVKKPDDSHFNNTNDAVIKFAVAINRFVSQMSPKLMVLVYQTWRVLIQIYVWSSVIFNRFPSSVVRVCIFSQSRVPIHVCRFNLGKENASFFLLFLFAWSFWNECVRWCDCTQKGPEKYLEKIL